MLSVRACISHYFHAIQGNAATSANWGSLQREPEASYLGTWRNLQGHFKFEDFKFRAPSVCTCIFSTLIEVLRIPDIPELLPSEPQKTSWDTSSSYRFES